MISCMGAPIGGELTCRPDTCCRSEASASASTALLCCISAIWASISSICECMSVINHLSGT